VVAQTSNHGLTVEALEQLYRARYRRFLNVALAVTGNLELARDAVQDGFAKAIRGRFGYRGNGSAESWVWSIVVNEARSVVRGTGVEILAEAVEVATAPAGEWPELRSAIAALPERQRLAVFLRHYADLDYEAIGDVLGIERGTVAASLHAAHATLRKQMSEVA
jgi:RNA polymerase sigma-70 factor, ECF subfamily